MAKRKADGDPPSKRKPKKQTASGQQNTKPETPAARAYRLKRAERSAHIPSDTSATDPETHDVYAFPPTLPSPLSSNRQASPATPKVDSSVLDHDARLDTSSVKSSPTISSEIIDEETLLAILCGPDDHNLAKDSIDDGLTKAAFDAIMQHAAAAAEPGDEFGVLFTRRFISKLAATHINQDWLVEVIHILQQNLESLCDRARCQIQSLGKLPLPDRPRLKAIVSTAPPSDAAKPRDEGMSKKAFKNIKAKRMVKPAKDQEDVGHRDRDVVSVQSKQSKRKTKDARQGLQPASKHFSTTQDTTAPDGSPQKLKSKTVAPNLQPQGAPTNPVYDFFVRSATESTDSAAEQSIKAIRIFNKRIRMAWRRMEPEQEAAWVELFNARSDGEPQSAKGKELLWLQGLLADLLPDESKPKHSS